MNMSLRAYARHRGVALSAVQKAIASGRIHPEPDGQIDATKADAQWEQHTRTAQPTTPKVTTSQVTTAQVTTQKVITPKVATTPASAAPQVSASPQASDDTRGVDYHKARAVRETYAARLAKLEFEERTDKLVSKAEVETHIFTLARQLRERMQQIPRKVAPEIVALVVAAPDVRGVTDILDTAIREALEELSQ